MDWDTIQMSHGFTAGSNGMRTSHRRSTLQHVHIEEGSGTSHVRRVLVVAADPVILTRIMNALDDPAAHVTLSPDESRALDLLKAQRWDLVVCNYPLPHLVLRSFVRELRSRTSASRSCGLIVLSITELLSGARRFVGAGVNAALARWASIPTLHATIERLLSVAPRFTPPPSTRVQIVTREGRKIAVNGVANLSITGALVESTQRPGVGASCIAEIQLPGSDRPIRVPSRVVRHTDHAREFKSGFALHFLELSPEEAQRIAQLNA